MSRKCFIALVFLLLLSGGCGSFIFPDPNVQYIAFGDSTTAGPSTRDYWEILQEKLNVSPDNFTGQGNGGESSTDGLARLNDLLSQEIFPNAQVLLYWEGGDDVIKFVRSHDPLLLLSPDNPIYLFSNQLEQALTQTQTNIEQAIKSAQDAGLTVFVANYFFLKEDLPCKSLPFDTLFAPQADNANVYVVRLNDRIRAAVQNQNAVLVDVSAIADSLRQDPSNYFDCNHLSEKGNEIVAGLFFDALNTQNK